MTSYQPRVVKDLAHKRFFQLALAELLYIILKSGVFRLSFQRIYTMGLWVLEDRVMEFVPGECGVWRPDGGVM